MIDTSQAHEIWPVPARFSKVLPRQWASPRGGRDYPEEWAVVKTWLRFFPRYLRDAIDPAEMGKGLLLIGEAGVGKTMLASSVLNFLRGHGHSVAFARDGDLHSLLTRTYLDTEDEERLLLLRRSACVVVDDMLRGGGRSEELEPFLRYRQDEGKPTVITMNDQVTLSPVLASFLHEYTRVSFKGEDVRKVGSPGARW